jgi:ribose 5-phosphate isomerase A
VAAIDPQLRAIKGGGGAMLREKVAAASARRMIAIADSSKCVAALGNRPVPIEILAQARSFVAGSLQRLGGDPALRQDDEGEPSRTDQGNPILDCRFPSIDDPTALSAALATIPGVLAHGLFVREIDALFVGTADGVVRRERHHAD